MFSAVYSCYWSRISVLNSDLLYDFQCFIFHTWRFKELFKVSLSPRPPLPASAFLPQSLPACLLLSLHLSIQPSIQPSIHPSIYPSARQPDRLPARPSIHLSIYISLNTSHVPDVFVHFTHALEHVKIIFDKLEYSSAR